jgi:hypothetical protein
MIRLCFLLVFISGWSALAQDRSTILSGITPCGQEMRSALDIGDKVCESIRWKITMTEPGRFDLVSIYGEGLPNTMDYKGGGVKSELSGQFQISSSGEKKIVYELKSPGLKSPLLLWQLDKNIFHFLGNDKKALRGDGGHSYTLNKVK